MINTTEPPKAYDHQTEATSITLSNLNTLGYSALFMSQGTGKTRCVYDTATTLFKEGKIDCLITVAPNGTHIANLKEAEVHIETGVEYYTAYWKSVSRKWERDRLATLIDPSYKGLSILAVNVESLRTPRFQAYVNKIYKRYGNVLLCMDESHQIKAAKSQAAKAAVKMGDKSTYKLISTGSGFDERPTDIFMQGFFLSPKIFGFPSSISAISASKVFTKKYCNIKYIGQSCTNGGRCVTDAFNVCERCHKRSFDIPMVVSYRRLDELKTIIDKFSYTKLLKDCVTLPDRKTITLSIEMGKSQLKAYVELKDNLLTEIKGGILSTTQTLDAIVRLRQLAGGSYKTDESEGMFDSVPKLDKLIEMCKSIDPNDGVIIWCSFTAENIEITKRLRKEFGEESTMTYYGGTSSEDREKAREAFKTPESSGRFLVANPVAGGTGLNLCRGSYVFYYSLTYSAVTLLQSKARNYRIGQTNKCVLYYMLSKDSIDETILQAHEEKSDIANLLRTNPVSFLE